MLCGLAGRDEYLRTELNISKPRWNTEANQFGIADKIA